MKMDWRYGVFTPLIVLEFEMINASLRIAAPEGRL